MQLNHIPTIYWSLHQLAHDCFKSVVYLTCKQPINVYMLKCFSYWVVCLRSRNIEFLPTGSLWKCFHWLLSGLKLGEQAECQFPTLRAGTQSLNPSLLPSPPCSIPAESLCLTVFFQTWALQCGTQTSPFLGFHC